MEGTGGQGGGEDPASAATPGPSPPREGIRGRWTRYLQVESLLTKVMGAKGGPGLMLAGTPAGCWMETKASDWTEAQRSRRAGLKV